MECSALSSVGCWPRTLQTRRLDTQLVTNRRRTIMSTIIPPQRTDSDGPWSQPHLVILAHNVGIWGLAYLSDGGRVVTGSKGTVKVWNLESGKQEGSSMWPVHERGICGLAVTGDGTNMASSDSGGTVKGNGLTQKAVSRLPSRQMINAVGTWSLGRWLLQHGRRVGRRLGCLLHVILSRRNETVCDSSRRHRCGTLISECHQNWVLDAAVVTRRRDGSRLFSGSHDAVGTPIRDRSGKCGQVTRTLYYHVTPNAQSPTYAQ